MPVSCGNLGARPKPPHCGSNCEPSASAAPSSTSRPIAPAAASPEAVSVRSSAAVSLSACPRSSSRRVRHASSTARHTSVKLGMPWRATGG